MRNLKVFIAYNGAAYHGFQRQGNAVTVQETVERAIGKLLKTPPPVETQRTAALFIYICFLSNSTTSSLSFSVGRFAVK